MSKDLLLDWNGLVDAAKKRRKERKLSQRKLAELSGVASPTVVRFEAGDVSVTLKSALAILSTLNLLKTDVEITSQHKKYQ